MQGKDDSDVTDHTVMLLPLPNRKHLLLGDEVTEDKPKRTSFGRPFSLCMPFSTRNLLRNKVKARGVEYRTYDLDSLPRIHKDGITMKIVKGLGLMSVDGINTMIAGGLSVLLFTTECNGVLSIIAVSVCSGERSINITNSEHALDAAANSLFKEDSRSQWIRADCGPAMTKAHDQMLASGDISQVGACSVHLLKNNLPSLKPKLNNRENYSSMFRDVTRMIQFPPPLRDKVFCRL
jgi:hypothetical protein